MEKINNYLGKLEYLSALFDKCLPCNNDDPVKTSNKFVFQLVLEMCNDKYLQKKVLTKLQEYTNYTTMYLSGVQLKPKYFDEIIQIYNEFVVKKLENRMNISEKITSGYIVNFSSFKDNIKFPESNYVWGNEITMNTDSTLYEIESPCSIYNYEEIIMDSIVGDESIQEYGVDGFLALLIVSLNEDSMINKVQVDSLLTMCQKNLANKFNMLRKKWEYSISQSAFNKINNHKLARMFQPKKILTKWIDFLESISHLPTNIIEDSIRYMNEPIQMIFFKILNVHDDTVIIHYKTNFDIVKYSTKVNFNDKELSIIKNMLEIKSIKEWINFLYDLILLEGDTIIKIFLHIEPKFALVFFGIDIEKENCLFKLYVSTKKTYELIKGKLYDKCLIIYNFDSIKTCTTWKYDKDLNFIGYKIIEYGEDNKNIVKRYNENNILVAENCADLND
ncbi:putative orfan [Tupanvirus soda lake]|uniref:Orfan n=2 Tax=Tupanvirus TaxID=2094720 RepID=A0AC62AB02_9VIRU|nr:putative orfan [Tupanvirus soda lake]QKU34960.1 putative orfan [Tupanvirus soda lake]